MAKRPNLPINGRFQKGQSGNPNGRPKAVKERQVSPFEIIFDKKLAVTQDGVSREIPLQEGMEHRNYWDAMGGSRLAQRTVLRWIAKREKLRAATDYRNWPKVTSYLEDDPENADAALQTLGIATRNADRDQEVNERVPLLLERWAVEAALARRRGGQRLNDQEIDAIERCTRDAERLHWPRGYKK